MFVGREQELASLEEFYAKDGIGMTVIYGRRRIGKSTLITEFVKDKKTVFYTATKIGKTRNLELFSKQVLDLFMPGIENISFNSIEAVFDFIDKNMRLNFFHLPGHTLKVLVLRHVYVFAFLNKVVNTELIMDADQLNSYLLLM